MTDLYFKYKQILEDENKKIISSEVTEDGLILDVIFRLINPYNQVKGGRDFRQVMCYGYKIFGQIQVQI